MKIIIKLIAGLFLLMVLAVAGLGVYLSQANLAPWAVKFAKSMYHLDIPANDTLTIKLFPTLRVSAQNLEIPSLSGTSMLLKAGNLEARVKWSAFPIFWANPQLQSLTLSNATVSLHQPASGPANWQTASQAAAAADEPSATLVTAPATFTLPAFGQVSLTNVAVVYQNDATKQKINVQDINLDVNGQNLAQLQATLSAHLNGQLLGANITTNATDLSAVPLKGQLTFGSLQANIDAKVENQNSFTGQVTLQTPNVHDTYQQLTTQSLATVPAAPLRLTASVTADQKQYALDGLNVTLGSTLKLGGTLGGRLQPLPTAKGDITVQSDNLRALLATLQGKANPSVPAAPFRLSSQLEYDPQNLKLANLNVGLGESITANGTLTLQLAAMQGSAELTVQASSFRQAVEMLTGTSQPKLPAQPLTANAIAKIDAKLVSIPQLTLSVPGVLSANGNVTLAQQTPVDIKSVLTVEKLNLTAFGLCQQAAAGTPAAASGAAATAPTASSGTPWTSDPIDASVLKSFTGDIALTANNITCPSVPLSGLTAKVQNTADALTIENLTLNLTPSGKASVTGKIGHSGSTLTPQLALELSGFPAESLVPKASWSKGLALPVAAKASLSTSGNTTAQFANNLDGSLDFSSSGGRLPGSQTLSSLLSLESILNGNAAVPSAASQDINDLHASYTITNGVATAKDIGLKAAGDRITASGTGTINLPAWTISHTLLATVGGQKDIPLTINGNLYAPKFDLDSGLKSRVQGRLLTQGAKLLGGSSDGSKTSAVTGAVNNLLSGKGLDAAGVQNLLGAFTKPKAAAPMEAAPAATPEAAPATEPAPAATEPAPAQ